MYIRPTKEAAGVAEMRKHFAKFINGGAPSAVLSHGHCVALVVPINSTPYANSPEFKKAALKALISAHKLVARLCL